MFNNTLKVYDAIGSNNNDNMHSTTKFLYLLQESFISKAVVSTREFNKTILKDMDILIAGTGLNGNAHQVLSDCLDDSREFNDRALNIEKITYLDKSKAALDFLANYFAHIESNTGDHIPGRFIQGDATGLRYKFHKNTFDVVIAGLCDHILPWEELFVGARYVLKENGAFITTYPSTEIFSKIRENIYGISSNQTRYVMDGKETTLHSLTLTPKQLDNMYRLEGFKNVQTTNIFHDYNFMETQQSPIQEMYKPSQTIKKAAELIGKSLKEIPILVGGIGFNITKY